MHDERKRASKYSKGQSLSRVTPIPPYDTGCGHTYINKINKCRNVNINGIG